MPLMGRKQYFELENVVFVPFSDVKDCIARQKCKPRSTLLLFILYRENDSWP